MRRLIAKNYTLPKHQEEYLTTGKRAIQYQQEKKIRKERNIISKALDSTFKNYNKQIIPTSTSTNSNRSIFSSIKNKNNCTLVDTKPE